MRRKTYQADELRAGHTVFIVTGTVISHSQAPRYGVAEHVVASKNEPQPQPGEVHPYRMHPKIARYAATVTHLWRTRRAALREAARCQVAADRYFSSRGA